MAEISLQLQWIVRGGTTERRLSRINSVIPHPKVGVSIDSYPGGFVWHERAPFQRLDIMSVLCYHLPLCILFWKRTRLLTPFLDLPEDVLSCLSDELNIISKWRCVSRLQTPLALASANRLESRRCYLWNRCLGSMTQRVNIKRQKSCGRFYSTYVQSSRLQSLDRVQLVESNSDKAEQYLTTNLIRDSNRKQRSLINHLPITTRHVIRHFFNGRRNSGSGASWR